MQLTLITPKFHRELLKFPSILKHNFFLKETIQNYSTLLKV